MIRVDVDGKPVPQGSMSAIPFHRPCPKCQAAGRYCGRHRVCINGREIGANVVHDSDEIASWRSYVALAVKVALKRSGIRAQPAFAVGGVPIGILFRIDRPKGHYTSRGMLSAEGDRNPEPWHKPDADKLVRAILDACGKFGGVDEGLVYTDDAQVTRVVVAKAWSTPPTSKAGVSIFLDGTLTEIAAAIDAAIQLPTSPVQQAGLFG